MSWCCRWWWWWCWRWWWYCNSWRWWWWWWQCIIFTVRRLGGKSQPLYPVPRPKKPLFTVHCTLYLFSLFTVHCSLFTVYCSLFTVHCTLYSVCSTMMSTTLAYITSNWMLDYDALHCTTFSTAHSTMIHYIALNHLKLQCCSAGLCCTALHWQISLLCFSS